jgi:ribosome biogenesis GTPase A
MTKICFGCGAQLQSDNQNAKGYIPKNKIDDASYCMRCFRMMHYGEQKVMDTPKDAKEIIRKVNKDNKFVIFLCDYLNINTYVMDLFKSIKNNKVLVINKGELLPDNITYNMVRNFVQDKYSIYSDIKVKGGTANHGVKSIYKYLMDNNIHEAYLLGISNSGKSTFINDMATILESKINKINVNSHANTTLDFMRVKLNNQLTLIDSPGFIIPNSLNNDVTNKDIKMLSYNLKDNEVIQLLNNKYHIKIENGTPITFYTNLNDNNLIKKYYKEVKLSNELNIDDNQDLIILGIGIIRFKNKTKITTNIPTESIEIRDSIFGGYYE